LETNNSKEKGLPQINSMKNLREIETNHLTTKNSGLNSLKVDPKYLGGSGSSQNGVGYQA